MGNTSLTSLIADLINLRVKEHCPVEESAGDVRAAEAIEVPAVPETEAVHSTLNAGAKPFAPALNVGAKPIEPANTKKAVKPKRKKQATQDAPGPIQMQVAALQYQAAQAQMAQMAYLQRLRFSADGTVPGGIFAGPHEPDENG